MNALVKSHCRSLGFIISCLCLHLTVFAQLKANFTATPLSGCSPLVVYFSDASTGNPSSWRWDLGNGVISTLKNPSATYFNPGTYTIRLTVRTSTGADSIIKQQYITVYGSPVVDFSATDTFGCFPKAIQFNDKSIAGSGTISNWEWDFGDGTVSTQKDAQHIYTSAGNYNVTLRVTNSFGCTKTVTKTQYIRITEGAKASFNIGSQVFCSAPATVQFTNASTGATANYVWEFGDGSSSSATNPSHTYATNGNYTVTLVAISAQGCKDTLKKVDWLNIGTNHSDFSIPNVLCVGESIKLTNTSPTSLSSYWSFGDGTYSDSVHPYKAFALAGTYPVKLVNDFGSCKDSITKQVVVAAKPKAGFDAGTKSFCKTPATVPFQSQSTNAASYFWNFGDGTSSVTANPIHTYYAYGNYTVTLVVTNASGCSDTITKTEFIKVQKPRIELLNLPRSGCVPLSINPSAKILTNQGIASYLWKFGDGSTSTSATPSHIYSAAGTYSITLVITTTGGCTDSVTLTDAVRAGNKPHAEFTVQPAEVCNSNPAQFTDNSTGNVDEWHWDFGDHYSSTDENPAHVFDGIGKFTVGLIASSNGCADTIIKQEAVNVLPPVSLFSIDKNCTDKYKAFFKDESIGATNVEWDFGDGTTTTARNTAHTYTAPGRYKVVLKTFNSTCSNLNYTFINIVDEKAKIVVDKNNVCKGSITGFSAPTINSANISKWEWDFGDGVIATDSIATTHSYLKSGTYSVKLTITDINGCTSSDVMQVFVFGPKADFTVSSPSACLKDNNISFTNLSSSDGTHNTLKSIWSFGDGSKDSTTSSPFQHRYSDTGSYTISLLVKDNYGCTDELIKTAAVIIAQPVAAFSSTDTMSCTEKNISFKNASTGINAEYRWSFGDQTTSSSFEPTHTYSNVGSYTIKLFVTDKYGCKDSVTKNNYINISLPKAKFIVSDSIGNCPPLIVNFTNRSTEYVSLDWDFGDGNHSTLPNPTHYYNRAGTFIAKLIATGPGGCTDIASQKIVVKGPSGTFTYTPLSGCNPLMVNFSAITQNTTSFVWDFSDGNTLSGKGTTATHQYLEAGEYVPKIILTDASGCNVPIVGEDTIRVYQVKADFISDISKLCKQGNIQFTNKSISNDLITSYHWNFGDRSTSTEANPLHFYDSAGTYTIKLTTLTQNGCIDSIALEDTITILPAPSIGIESINEVCAGTKISFRGIVKAGNESELTWKWNLANGNSANSQQVIPQKYTSAGDYTITTIATALNGCKDTATKKITVHPLPTVHINGDEWICLGTETQLHASGADTYSWEISNPISCKTCANPTVTPEHTTTYFVTGTTRFGCIDKDSFVVRVQQPFEMKVEPGDTICKGETVHLVASGADSYTWTPSTNIQNPNSASTTATPQTTTTYHAIGKDIHNCFTDTADVFIKVWPIPTVNAGTDQTLIIGQALQLTTTVSTDVSSWQWSSPGTLSCPTCSTTLAKPKQTTTYRVVVKNDGGCSANDDVTVNVICNNGNLFVPNSFSPNGDGVNDRFYPSGTGINRIKTLRVFNRWGEVVFEKINFSANDFASGWDGKYKGELLTPDLYIWSCEVICENNETLSFKGDVTLLR